VKNFGEKISWESGHLADGERDGWITLIRVGNGF
jgi:hypothetical protein